MFDFLTFLKDYGIQYWDHGKNVQEGWLNVQCPFCGDRSNHLGLNSNGDYGNCWNCGGHKTVDIISNLASCSVAEAIKIHDVYTGRVRLRESLNEKKPLTNIEVPGSLLTAFERKYLEKRGFNSDHLIQKYRLKGGLLSGKFGHRIIVPVYHEGFVVAYQGRTIAKDVRPKYLFSPKEISAINPKHTLYNLDHCKGKSIGVVEGVFDVFRMGDNFCSTFGSSITPEQISLLSKYDRIVFLFDSEREAQKKATQAATKLGSLGKDVEVVNIEGSDPGDLPNAVAKEMKRQLGL